MTAEPTLRRSPAGDAVPRSRWTLPVASGAGFLSGLDTTAVNVALPDIPRDLAPSLGELQWVVNAFALLSATLLVVAGGLSDRFGARRVFVAGVAGFAVASAGCALTWSPVALDVARAAQGAASAVVVAGGLALLAGSYRAEERGRALGLYGSMAASSFVVGPLIGGLLTDAFGWRSIFWANVPVATLLGVVALTALADPPRSRPPRVARFDVAGVATFVLGLGVAQYALLRAGDVGLRSLEVAGAALFGVAVLVAFVLVERRDGDGVVDLRLFGSRTFSGAAVTIAIAAAAYFGLLVYLSLFLQSAQHMSAFRTGWCTCRRSCRTSSSRRCPDGCSSGGPGPPCPPSGAGRWRPGCCCCSAPAVGPACSTSCQPWWSPVSGAGWW